MIYRFTYGKWIMYIDYKDYRYFTYMILMVMSSSQKTLYNLAEGKSIKVTWRSARFRQAVFNLTNTAGASQTGHPSVKNEDRT